MTPESHVKVTRMNNELSGVQFEITSMISDQKTGHKITKFSCSVQVFFSRDKY